MSRKQLQRDLHQLLKDRPINDQAGNDQVVEGNEPLRSAFDEAVDKAQNLLAGSLYWSSYQSYFACSDMSPDIFGLVQLYQQRSSGGLGSGEAVRRITFEPFEASDPRRAGPEIPERTLKKETSAVSSWSVVTADAAPTRLEVEDEEVVNFALVLFLNALTRITPAENVRGDWWPCRSCFKVRNS